MRRRTFLSAAIGLSAGCVAPAASAPNEPTTGTGRTEGVDTDSGDGDATSDDGDVVIRFRLVNDADDRREVTVEATRTATPECRYADPQCGAPSRTETVLSETVVLAADATATRTARASLSADIDTFSVEAATGGGRDELAGLAAGDRLPEHDPADYPWRVAPGSYELLVRVEDGVTVAGGD